MLPVIRAASAEDVPALQDLFRRAALANEGDRELLAAHPEFLDWSGSPVVEGRTRVAEVQGRVVGFVTTLATGAVAELEDLFVDPDWMRRGIGRALIDDLVSTGARHGVTCLEVDANPHALAFYREAGFVEVGPAVLEHGLGVRMSLPLPAADEEADRRPCS